MRIGPRLVLFTAVAILAVVALVVWWNNRDEGSLAIPSVLPSASGAPETLLAVGDVASCDTGADEAVADLASRLPGTIALLGDIAYENGTPAEFRECFDPAWGPMRPRIRPAVGNHEYQTDDAAGYFDYFGAAAGERGKGWYSYDLGAWHVVVLNSICEVVDCGPDSPQLDWLRTDLAAHPSECLLAYWHYPRWSSGRHGSQAQVEPFWAELRAAGADIVLTGHDHTYERIRADGIREFVVGTGGRSHYRFLRGPLPTTEVRNDSTFGLMWLALGDGSYQWQFLGLGDGGFTDSGAGSC